MRMVPLLPVWSKDWRALLIRFVERATAILRQLLWNAHETTMEMRTVAINQVVLQAIELQQASLNQERIRLETDLDQSWPLVHGDAGQLQQVFRSDRCSCRLRA
jgi:C4-dicarboxylate-specific signal transduction histidine kinase